MSFELTWFPLYADRLLASRRVRRMDATEFGIYLSLLVEEWTEGGPIPDDDADLEMMGRAPIEDVRRILKLCFEKNGKGWSNPVIEEIRTQQLAKRRRRQEAGRKGGEAKATKKD